MSINSNDSALTVKCVYKAKVLYSFEAQGAGELTIREGEIVTITNQASNHKTAVDFLVIVLEFYLC